MKNYTRTELPRPRGGSCVEATRSSHQFKLLLRRRAWAQEEQRPVPRGETQGPGAPSFTNRKLHWGRLAKEDLGVYSGEESTR